MKRLSGAKWSVVERIVWALLFIFPAMARIGYALEHLFR
jgi:hypothetical protein